MNIRKQIIALSDSTMVNESGYSNKSHASMLIKLGLWE